MNKLMIGVMTSIILMCGCAHRQGKSPVELSDGIHGVYVPCETDLECEIALNGACKNGYKIAQYMKSKAGSMTGWVVMCRE